MVQVRTLTKDMPLPQVGGPIPTEMADIGTGYTLSVNLTSYAGGGSAGGLSQSNGFQVGGGGNGGTSGIAVAGPGRTNSGGGGGGERSKNGDNILSADTI